jgi:glycosyltransferase involved in cell wall biosynthesis
MSPANLNYVLENNPEIENIKLEVNPNSIEVKKNSFGLETDLYIKYNIPRNKVIFIFGGNLGIPQGIDFLKVNITYCKSIKEVFFLIVGDGTEYDNFSHWIQAEGIINALLIKELPKSEYDEIIRLSHVGLIFLNPLFTIPNFPSRILSYLQNCLPVICATDIVTDIGEIAVNNNFGYKCLTSDSESFFEFVVKLLDKDLREQLGKNGFEFLSNEYSVENSYNKIIAKF